MCWLCSLFFPVRNNLGHGSCFLIFSVSNKHVFHDARSHFNILGVNNKVVFLCLSVTNKVFCR